MSKNNHKGGTEAILPPIMITTDDARRLNALASSSVALFPRVAHFLKREMGRASAVANDSGLRGVVHMGSQVRLRRKDGRRARRGVGLSPRSGHHAKTRFGADARGGGPDRPIGRAKAIEFQTPGHQKRSLRILSVTN